MAVHEARPLRLDSELDDLFETLEHYGDRSNAQILSDLRSKLETQEVTAACCGYVSAGKSRLVNALIKMENLLPVSPLPTSMNSVYIRQVCSPKCKLG